MFICKGKTKPGVEKMTNPGNLSLWSRVEVALAKVVCKFF